MIKYAKLAPNKVLQDILVDEQKLDDYLFGRDVLDLVSDFPVKKITANELTGILRKLPARLYSIASSPKTHPGEVHLTVSAVRYTVHGRTRHGVCSTFLADRIGRDSKVLVYIDKNKNFKLPSNHNTPIIMVGPGTGVAPFRSFLEERDTIGGGENWLFFGDRHFITDFLYQLEWQRYIKSGTLTRLDVAFSRDQKEKIYVQHKMMENCADLFNWLENGAYFYVCGDEKKMAKDVHRTLINIVEKEGKMSMDMAEDYVRKLQKEKRYQVDVY